jgi:hypothetical protein
MTAITNAAAAQRAERGVGEPIVQEGLPLSARMFHGVAFPPGPYDVRFDVKDTSDFKIVLYHGFFPFGVQ